MLNFTRRPKVRKGQWKTRDGRVMDVRDMGENHLINAIRYFKDRRDEESLKVWDSYQGLVEELTRRGSSGKDGWLS